MSTIAAQGLFVANRINFLHAINVKVCCHLEHLVVRLNMLSQMAHILRRVMLAIAGNTPM